MAISAGSDNAARETSTSRKTAKASAKAIQELATSVPKLPNIEPNIESEIQSILNTNDNNASAPLALDAKASVKTDAETTAIKEQAKAIAEQKIAAPTDNKSFATKPNRGKASQTLIHVEEAGLSKAATDELNKRWMATVNADEDVSTSITQTWTDQAIKCYLTQADCANCSIPRGNYSFDCQMNKVVPALLGSLGSPDLMRLNKLLPYMHQY